MKRKYSTGLIVKYKLGLLSTDIIREIPSSTRSYWKNEISINKIFGIENFQEDEDNIKLLKLIYENERLTKLVRLLSKSYIILLQIFNTIENKNIKLYKNKNIIINIIDEYKTIFGVKKVCKLLNISYKKYFTWKYMIANCVDPIKEVCKRVSPMQLSFFEQNTIKNYLLNQEYENWGIANIYYQMIKDNSATMSLSSFRNYSNKFMPKRILPKNIKKIKRIGIRATKPFEKIHMDVTIYRPLDNTKVYIYFIVDNFSRKILSWIASLDIKADISFQNLENACIKNNLFNNNTELIVDGGSENKGSVNDFILSRNNWSKIIAKKDIIFSNSIVEAVNKIIKYNYLFKKNLSNINELIKYLEYSVKDYNNRPHSVLKLSPNDVADGNSFDAENYKMLIQKAKTNRIYSNLNCGLCNLGSK